VTRPLARSTWTPEIPGKLSSALVTAAAQWAQLMPFTLISGIASSHGFIDEPWILAPAGAMAPPGKMQLHFSW
jgi:hypothetical protein